MKMTKPNANYRRDPIPLWINALSILVMLILLYQSVSAYFNPAWAFGSFDNSTSANQEVMKTLAGRNVVMLLLTLMAVKSQNAMFLAYSFLMHLIREVQDMFIHPYYAGFATATGIMMVASFLLVFIIPYVFAIKKLRTLAMVAD